MAETPPPLEQELESILAECDRLKANYNSLGATYDRQLLIWKLMAAFLTGISLTLFALGLSQDCLNEILLLLGGLTAAGATVAFIYSREPKPPKTDTGGG